MHPDRLVCIFHGTGFGIQRNVRNVFPYNLVSRKEIAIHT
jgi:hypothetical protein